LHNNLITDRCLRRSNHPNWQFKHITSLTMAGIETPGWQIWIKRHNLPMPIYEDRINSEAHKEHMNATAWFNQQSTINRQRLAP
jgi:hypothetical protein